MIGVITMAIAHTKIFMSNKSQTVRLPKSVEFPESLREVDIVAIGLKRIITPTGQSWDDWFDNPGASEDFMLSREQPADQQRETSKIDDQLFEKCRQLTGITEKTALLREGLKALIERESAQRLAQLGGTEPELQTITRRQSKPA